MLIERSQVSSDDKWNVEALYTNFESWQQEYKNVYQENNQIRWPEIQVYRGRLGKIRKF